jgi:hypothetical protein
VSHFWTYIRDALCKALSAAEREAVMGDFAELGLTDRRAATSLLELVLRRQLRAWKEWQPWFTTLAIILPVCPLLAMLCTQLSMSVWPSVVSWVHHEPSYDTGLSPSAFWGAICLRASALATWSWTSGFALGALSRRTPWVSGVLFFGSYVVLANMGQPFSVRLCWLTGVVWLPVSINLLCVLLPAYCGIRRSSRMPDLKFLRVLGLALWTTAMSALALWSRAWDQAAMENWVRGGSALTLMQLTRHPALWNAGTTELLITAALAAPIFYVLASDALGVRR